jgi:hypothetical protein
MIVECELAPRAGPSRVEAQRHEALVSLKSAMPWAAVGCAVVVVVVVVVVVAVVVVIVVVDTAVVVVVVVIDVS